MTDKQQRGTAAIALDHNRRFERIHQTIREAVEAALEQASRGEQLPSGPGDMELGKRLDAVLEPLLEEEPFQANALMVLGQYLWGIAAHAEAVPAEPSVAGGQVTPEMVSVMHHKLFGYRPNPNEAVWSLPAAHLADGEAFEDYLDFLEYKQVRRMLTAIAAFVLLLRRHADPHRVLAEMERGSMDAWAIPDQGASQGGSPNRADQPQSTCNTSAGQE